MYPQGALEPPPCQDSADAAGLHMSQRLPQQGDQISDQENNLEAQNPKTLNPKPA